MTPRKEKWNGLCISLLFLLSGLMIISCADDDDSPADADTAGTDSGTEVGTDSGTDVGTDSGTDAGTDAGTDSDTVSPEKAAWMTSGHADAEAEAFLHWSSEDDGYAVPTRCAKCHAGSGLVDFAADGVVDSAVNVAAGPDTIGCQDCHTLIEGGLSSVTMPSGAVISNSSNEMLCMNCHQGRNSGLSVDEAIAEAVAATDTDTSDTDVPMVDEYTVYAELGFSNIHYAASGATRYGSEAMGGYEYEGKAYDQRWTHATGYSDCVDCHDPHSLEVKVEACATCHTGVTTVADIRNIRMPGSLADYDGDGTVEGIYYELKTLTGRLLLQIKARAKNNPATEDIEYDSSHHPYWFVAGATDTEGNKVRYSTWTPALAKAAYNYQYAVKDHGAYAHNAKYVMQLLYDSLEGLSGPAAVTGQVRGDSGHFDGASEAFRHWDEDLDTDGNPEGVSASCATCHSVEGFVTFADSDVEMTTPAAYDSGFTCEMCHTDMTTGALRRVASTTFSNGLVVADDGETNKTMCMTCHQGRKSGLDVEAYTADESDTTGWAFRSLNMHYLGAGAMLFGAESNVGYQYADKTYKQAFTHVGSAASSDCTYCHQVTGGSHSFAATLDATACGACHSEATDVASIRKNRTIDYDGDGNVTEPLADELQTLADALYTQIRTVEPDLEYTANYPYWGFVNDTGAWTASLMRAAYNYHLHHTEPGAWAHNTDYMAQLLIDSIEDLGNTTHPYNRP